MTEAELRTYTRKELIELAKKRHISGWGPMRKDELIKALIANGGKKLRTTSRRLKSDRVNSLSRANGNGHNDSCDLSTESMANGKSDATSDTITATLCDSDWIRVEWQLSRAIVDRATAVLKTDWYTARPILRVYRLSTDELDTSSQSVAQDIVVRGGTNHWYVHVDELDSAYKFEIGYLTQEGRFYCLAGSNTVIADCDHSKRNGNGKSASDRFEYLKLYSPSSLVVGSAEDHDSEVDEFDEEESDVAIEKSFSSESFVFEVDAQLIITGQTHPNAELTVLGESVDVHRDGSFQFRTDFSDGRRVYPTVAVTPDGLQQRTVVVAVERNTKELEPMMFGQE